MVNRDSGFLPAQRLWTPWRMAYVSGSASEPGCVFCNALATEDDVSALIVHRGEHAFVILNLYPYNTGHVMVVPNQHVTDLADLSPEARFEMAELTSSFCIGLRLVMGCDGLNAGMNLGSAAGAGIADHLHQHIVPRWTGDANFMPIVGQTKVLPELLAATYAKLRAEVARQKSGAKAATVVLLSSDGNGIYIADESLPRIDLSPDAPAGKTVMNAIAPGADSCELIGWTGAISTDADTSEPPALAFSFTPSSRGPYRIVLFDNASSILSGDDASLVQRAIERFAKDDSRS